uniref:40S ribosomal protein S15a n=1 Tax=Megaselia scalaris TaxID=36166 RepID=T1GQX8_MEGSC
MKHGYIGEFEIVDDHRSRKIVVNLTGLLYKCGIISPRFNIPINDIEKWTNNLLPIRQFGRSRATAIFLLWVFKCPSVLRGNFSPPQMYVLRTILAIYFYYF